MAEQESSGVPDGGWQTIGFQQGMDSAIRWGSEEQASQATNPTDSEAAATNVVGLWTAKPGHEAIPSSADIVSPERVSAARRRKAAG
ncbi:hypothetical protein A4X13_0g8041 [Tilletia indica]|uniref:Uncharacterized protein n=1 Tax=Tilletia indica TaxID=43049 RepID=A0A8T8SHH6_9BASI|nr:hypothetical protein A4X13_0g8041 [Tilletia indica]